MFAEFVQVLLTAFPDLRMSVEDTLIDGTKAAVRWTLRATHTGALMDVPASGRAVQIDGMDMFTLANAKIVEMWVALDTLALTRQVNALPLAATALEEQSSGEVPVAQGVPVAYRD